MSSDDRLKWLRDLNSELWKEEVSYVTSPRLKKVVSLVVARPLTKQESDQVFACIEGDGLLTEMTSDSMFGGYCMLLYDHPPCFGVTPIKLFDLSERVLPPFDRYDRLGGELPAEKKPGCGTDRAWELFSRYTHSEKNRKWLEYYGMGPPRERGYYDY
jgi:hypothetical protein